MYLVSGATGNVGRQVVTQLLAAGTPVRGLVRRADVGLPAGVEAVVGDLTAPDTLPAALAGVRAAFLFPVPGCGPAFAAAARAAGVARIVLLSSGEVLDGGAAQPHGVAGFHAEIERAVAGCGVGWTFLRCGAFATNTLQWAGMIRAGDTVGLPFPQAQFAPVHEADVAAVAVAALIGEGHAGARYRLTGPAALTQAEQVATIGAVLGRRLRVAEVPAELFRERLLQRGVPAAVADGLVGMFAAATTRPAEVLPTVQEVTGHPARSYAAWVADHRRDFG
jgi:uncharacterized protein YbjT (DUF2867 family)